MIASWVCSESGKTVIVFDYLANMIPVLCVSLPFTFLGFNGQFSVDGLSTNRHRITLQSQLPISHNPIHSNSETLHKNTHSSTPMDRPTTLSPSHNEEDEKQFTDFLFGELETDTPAVHLSHSFHLLARSQEGEEESRSLARSRRRNGFRVPGK